jgi:LysR family transcriptional regulator, cys regulon transcriptional activator
MKLQHLRCLCAIAQHGFSISRAADALETSQPAISKQIRLLETELGADLLIRRGNRITGLTAVGEAIIDAARRTVWEAQNLERITDEFTQKGSGRLVIATTHMYARYVLRSVIKDFIQAYPQLKLVLRQTVPSMIPEWIASGEADMGIVGKPPSVHDELIFLEGGTLQRSVIVPKRHPLLREPRLTLKAVAQYPIVTLDPGLEGGATVMNAFAAANLSPNVVLSALDADVVKSYVELGLGVAVLAAVTFEPDRDRELRAIPVPHLFRPTIFHVVLRRGKHLPGTMYDFINRLTPRWDRAAVESSMRLNVAEV